MRRLSQIILGMVLISLFHACATTPDLHESVRIDGVEPLTELIKIPIGGVDQWLLIRSANPSNPVFLFIHGGPGAAEMPLLRHYNYALEKHFTVVMWDQRGAGKSNENSIPPESINMVQLLDDTHEIVQYLKNRFYKSKIFLAGHSFGTVLGIQAIDDHPEDFYAYVGIGQVVDMKRNIESSYMLCTELANKNGNKKDIRAFSGMQINGRFSGGSDLEKALYMRDWISKNGRIFYDRNNINNLSFVVLTAPEYTLFEKLKYMNGLKKSRVLLWTPDLFEVNFFKDVPTLEVPVYFVSGKYDYITSDTLVREYFNFVQAPYKELIEFENSAHCAIFEEPLKFNQLMINKILNHAVQNNEENSIVPKLASE
ncbi:MAG: alpha/beta hydrolase [Verrucomicrobiota bacterium]